MGVLKIELYPTRAVNTSSSMHHEFTVPMTCEPFTVFTELVGTLLAIDRHLYADEIQMAPYLAAKDTF
jgi:hypothetical protein